MDGASKRAGRRRRNSPFAAVIAAVSAIGAILTAIATGLAFREIAGYQFGLLLASLFGAGTVFVYRRTRAHGRDKDEPHPAKWVLVGTGLTLVTLAVSGWLIMREADFRFDGTDPGLEATGCAQGSFEANVFPVTEASGAVLTEGIVQYSPVCGTNWIRVNLEQEGAEVIKTIHRSEVRNWLPFPVPLAYSETEVDDAVGWTYSMQIWAKGDTCVHAQVDVVEDGTVVATGETRVCGDRPPP